MLIGCVALAMVERDLLHREWMFQFLSRHFLNSFSAMLVAFSALKAYMTSSQTIPLVGGIT